MSDHARVKRIVVVAAIAASSIVAAVPTLTSATGAGRVDAVTTTTKAATTTTTTINAKTTTTTGTTTTSKNYEVVAGIFLTKAKAQAQIDALTKAKFTKFTIKNISPKFAVVKASLTKAQATKLAKQINTNATVGKARIKKLA